MGDATVVLAGLAAGTYVLKAAGPLLLGGRRLPAGVEAAAGRLPAALLAALVLVSAATDGRALQLDARAAGVAAGAVALRFRAPFVLVVVAAVAATAAARALAGT